MFFFPMSLNRIRSAILLLLIAMCMGEDPPAAVPTYTTGSAALLFLTRHQGADGSWDPLTYTAQCTLEPKCEPGVGGPDDQVALTAQALRCFFNAGYDHKQLSKHRAAVASGLAWLRAKQREDGSFSTSLEAHIHATAIMGIALAMTNDQTLMEPTQRAATWLLEHRLRETAIKPVGWGDKRGVSTLLTMEGFLALRACSISKLELADSMERIWAWVEQVWWEENPQWATFDPYVDEARFPAWRSAMGKRQGEATLAAAVLTAFRHPNADAQMWTLMNRGKRLLLEPGALNDKRTVFCAQVAGFMFGSEWFQWWLKYSRPQIWETQRRGADCLFGSWDPPADQPHGRLQSTFYSLRADSVIRHPPDVFVR